MKDLIVCYFCTLISIKVYMFWLDLFLNFLELYISLDLIYFQIQVCFGIRVVLRPSIRSTVCFVPFSHAICFYTRHVSLVIHPPLVRIICYRTCLQGSTFPLCTHCFHVIHIGQETLKLQRIAFLNALIKIWWIIWSITLLLTLPNHNFSWQLGKIIISSFINDISIPIIRIRIDMFSFPFPTIIILPIARLSELSIFQIGIITSFKSSNSSSILSQLTWILYLNSSVTHNVLLPAMPWIVDIISWDSWKRSSAISKLEYLKMCVFFFVPLCLDIIICVVTNYVFSHFVVLSWLQCSELWSRTNLWSQTSMDASRSSISCEYCGGLIMFTTGNCLQRSNFSVLI